MASGDKRKRRRSSAVVLLSGLFGLLILALVVVGGVVVYGLHLFYEPGPKDTETAFRGALDRFFNGQDDETTVAKLEHQKRARPR